MSQPRNICFYSNKCKWSKQFITELAQTPYKSAFRFICVDPSAQRPQLPGWLKKVPTIVIAGEDEPRTDNEVMNWLYEKRLQERGPGGGGAQATAAAAAVEQESGPQFYNPLEMASGADSYSFIEQDGRVVEGGSMISQAYEFVGSVAPGQERATMAVAPPSKTKKEQAFDSSMERYMAQRNQGVPQQVNRM